MTEAVNRNLASVTEPIVPFHLELQFWHSPLHLTQSYTRNLNPLGRDWPSKMKKSDTLFNLLLITVPATLALAHSGATGIVKERMDMFKKNQGNLKAIKSHIGSEDYESIVQLADEIRAWAVKMPDYFPEGSNEKPSEASPAIWTDFDGFKNAVMRNEAAATQLIAAAKAEDQKAVLDGFKAVAASCKSCHQSYKLD